MASWHRLVKHIRDRPLLADTLLAIALFVVGSAMFGVYPPELRPAADPATVLLWGAAGSFPIVLRRRWPWVAIGLVSVYGTVTGALGVPTEGFGLLVVTYTAAASLPLGASTAATVLMWGPAMVAAAVTGTHDAVVRLTLPTFVLFNTMAAVVAYLTGRVVFTRRRYIAALVERATAAEQNQQALAAQAVSEERRRIARELHDVVAHHVSVMGVLATGSRRMLQKDPRTADEALATIEETSRTVLREMRRLLDVLRTDPEPPDSFAPQPSLAGLAALVDQVREAGLEVGLTNRISGYLPDLDPGVALTLYRIVQEALTNVLKHAGPGATAHVRLDIENGCLALEVYDTGQGPPAAAHGGAVGHGLLGMKERVALFGGTLRTGPRPGGGFRVYARIPLEEAAA